MSNSTTHADFHNHSLCSERRRWMDKGSLTKDRDEVTCGDCRMHVWWFEWCDDPAIHPNQRTRVGGKW